MSVWTLRTPRRATALLVALSLALSGCATSAPSVSTPSTHVVEQVRAEKKMLLLLRIRRTEGGRPVDDPLRGGAVPGCLIRSASLDTTQLPTCERSTRSPSGEARRDGWFYLALDPGSYWLSPVPPGAVPDSQPGWLTVHPRPSNRYGYQWRGEVTAVPEFRAEVTGGDQVVYAGTLVFDASSEQKNALGGRWPREHPPDTVTLVDESADAEQVFGQAFRAAGFDRMTVRLMEAVGRPLPGGRLEELGPIGVATIGAGGMKTPSLMARALGLWLAPTGVLVVGGAEVGGYGGGALVLLGLAYAPVGALIGAIHGATAEHRWKPCAEQLDGELARTDPTAQLSTALADALASRVATSIVDVTAEHARQIEEARGIHSILLSQVSRVEIREGQSGFFVEVGLRTRLRDVRARRWVYDRSFVYSDGSSPLARPYEGELPEWSTGRKLQDYCGAEGMNTFRVEIERAIALTVTQVAADLGVVRSNGVRPPR
jgi:hypothetical protein